jgi:hypothetical protein
MTMIETMTPPQRSLPRRNLPGDPAPMTTTGATTMTMTRVMTTTMTGAMTTATISALMTTSIS